MCYSTEIISGNNKLEINGPITNIIKSSKTIQIDNELEETISNSRNMTVSGNTNIKSASNFTISFNNNLNMSTSDLTHITNTNNGELADEHRALVVNGGMNIQKESSLYYLIINGRLNAPNTTSYEFTGNTFSLNASLLTIGTKLGNLGTYSGIVSRSFEDSDKKFTGIVRNNLNTYAFVNNINVDTIDEEEYSEADLDTTYSNTPLEKISSFVTEIRSIQPNITARGEAYINKNMFIGIVDTPANDASDSLTLNIESNINATKTDLNIHSNRNIIYNISN